MIKIPKERPSAIELLNEPYISNYVSEFIQKSLENAKTGAKMVCLVNSMVYLNDDENEDNFGEYDDKSTLRPTPKSSIRTLTND